MNSYIEKHEKMLKEYNTKHIGYVYKGNKEWDYYYGNFSRMARRVNMSGERKKSFNERLNKLYPEAKTGIIYVEHYREGYTSEWSEKPIDKNLGFC